MNFDKLEKNMIIWFHWDLFRFISDDDLDGRAIGICEFNKLKESGKECIVDYRMYLYKENNEYIVLIYTSDKDYDKFTFKNFNSAYVFLDNLPYKHPQYKERPMRILDKETLIVIK